MQDPCIDYVGMHVWPDNWALKTPEFQKSFIESHLRDVAASIKGKPVILEECVPAQTGCRGCVC